MDRGRGTLKEAKGKVMANIQRVEYPDHPNRCQGLTNHPENPGGQCSYLAEEGKNYCILHGGVSNGTNSSLNLYRVRKFEKRLKDFTTANGARGIDEELAIMRMVLEEVLNKCDTEMELLLFSTKISELVGDIRNLVMAADRLASKRGMLIGRAEGMVIAGQVVTIISKYISDEIILGKIADEVGEAFLTPVPELS
jgi:hypothetical protein